MRTATIKPAEERLDFAKRRILPAVNSILCANFGKDRTLLQAGDNTLRTDIVVDDICNDLVRSKYPDDAILSEEKAKKGWYTAGVSDFQWIMDALDGSTNYRKKSPLWAVSIALKEKGELKAGLVHHPFSESSYHAVRGQGAFLNSYAPLEVSPISRLEAARVGLISDHCFERQGLDGLQSVVEQEVRWPEKWGCTSLEFASVATGVLDGIVKPTKNPWGVSAGILLVEESGGKVTTYRKGDVNIHVASNPYIHDSLCRVVKDYLRKK